MPIEAVMAVSATTQSAVIATARSQNIKHERKQWRQQLQQQLQQPTGGDKKMIATGGHTQNSTNWQHATSSGTDRSSDGRVDYTAVSGDSNCKSQQITFETKQSTIGDNSCNNQPAATKSSGNWQRQKQQEQLPIRQP